MALASVLFASAYSPVLSALGQTANVRVTSWQLARSRPFVRMVSGYARGDDGRKVDVDEALVDQLIEKRVAFREMKNFADADAIQEQLAAMGVTLRDKELTWVADGVKRKPKRASRRKESAAKVETPTSTAAPVPAPPAQASEHTDVDAVAEAQQGQQQQPSMDAVSAEVPAAVPPPPLPAPPAAAAAGQALQEAENGEEECAEPMTPRERLVELKELLEAGLIFPDEFEAKRAQILKDLVAGKTR